MKMLQKQKEVYFQIVTSKSNDSDDERDSDYESELASSGILDMDTDQLMEESMSDSKSENEQTILAVAESTATQKMQESRATEKCDPNIQEWEVECTSRVLKIMKYKKNPEVLKKAICTAIADLTHERQWSPVKTKRKDHHLYRKDLLRGKVTIYWEKAVQFSSKLTNESSGLPLYADVIRIWDIVIGSGKKMHQNRIKAIEKSWDRGKQSLGEHIKLSIFGKSLNRPTNRRVFSPILSSGDDFDIEVDPPAEPNQYKAITLHDVPSNIELLLSEGFEFELPIKMWPEEHRIINMQSKEPLVVLGRSGTGKTTCCLYRMVQEFVNYYKVQQSFPDKELPQLRQLFVTKNNRLCIMFEQQFFKLVGHYNYGSLCLPDDDQSNRNDSLDTLQCPIFITCEKFLSLLDSSLDGNTLQEQIQIDNNIGNENTNTSQITANYFINVIWKELVKKHPNRKQFDPLLVWMEIKSFITGSCDAFYNDSGRLSEEDYTKISSRIAPNFEDSRHEIYQIYEEYKQYCDRCRRLRSACIYDECELVLHIYQKLKRQNNPWLFSSLYVDEVQDFTQSEVLLLIHCLKNPNNIFLTGDTAQTVMQDVSFRFKDLKTSFFKSKSSPDHAPPILELKANYRSHSGILCLARCVLDVLEQQFPDSVDRVPCDQAMFPGPKPKFIKPCHKDTLMLILAANKRNPSSIQFGHHQAIIVKREEKKQDVPIENALIFSVYESKGLEFDDVLLYNFFTDCEVSLPTLVY